MRPGDGGGGGPARWTSASVWDEDPISGLDGTQHSVNMGDIFGAGSQVDSNIPIADDESGHFVANMEDVDVDSDNYVDFLVRCEGDSDVEDCFPSKNAVDDCTIEPMEEEGASHYTEGIERRKDAKYKAEMTRAVKRRALEGVEKVVDMDFSDVESEDNRFLSDSSDDDEAVEPKSVCVTKRKSQAKKLAKRVYYDESNPHAHEQFQVKLCFSDVHEYRRALYNYHIVHQRDFVFLRDDHNRITVCCKEEGTCPFVIMSSSIEGEATDVIRALVVPHTCGKTNKSSRMSSAWVAKRYEDHIRSDIRMKIPFLIEMVKKDYGVTITKYMAYRAKTKALKVVYGDHVTQYYRLRDYLQTVINTNPGSRCIVHTIVNSDPKKNPKFHRLFYCLNAQVQGFLHGCRPFIGVDGCFLKQGTGHQLLAATARDGNNNMFPLAFGIVSKEETASWCWFFQQLRYALGGAVTPHGTITFMSNRQKGLLSAVSQVFPECEHRFCLRHIYANFQIAGFRGEDLKKLVDAAAYAFSQSEHVNAMDKLKEENIDAWKWLSKIPTKHWARYAMDTTCKTDLVVNNLSEVFNSYILEQRDKPVVTMLEEIRTKLMTKFVVKRDGVSTARWEITPHYVEKLETEKRWSRWCTADASSHDIWQVASCHNGVKVVYSVNLQANTCGCRKWDLTGIPCKHAIAAIYKSQQFPEDFVSPFFKKPMYAVAYQEMIYPVPGQHDWVNAGGVDIEAPVFICKSGRKKTKRRPSQGEGSDGNGKLTNVTCSNCKLKGHRWPTCTSTLKPHLAARKEGRQTNRRLPSYMQEPMADAPPPSPPMAAAPSARRQAPAPSARRQAPPPRQVPQANAPYAPPRQASSAPRQAPPARNKLPAVRGRGLARGNASEPALEVNVPRAPPQGVFLDDEPQTRLFSYFTASRGPGRNE